MESFSTTTTSSSWDPGAKCPRRWTSGVALTRLALAEMFEYPFLRAQVSRLQAVTSAENVKAQRCLDRLGFLAEGRLRRAHDGSTDALIYSMLPSECRWLRHGTRKQRARRSEDGEPSVRLQPAVPRPGSRRERGRPGRLRGGRSTWGDDGKLTTSLNEQDQGNLDMRRNVSSMLLSQLLSGQGPGGSLMGGGMPQGNGGGKQGPPQPFR